MGWIGVDLDHTLALYESGMAGLNQIGKPVPRMLRRVKGWLKQGREVRIMTARVNRMPGWDHEAQRKLVENWCLIHVGQRLQVTNEKDLAMICLYDDRAVGVEPDTGRLLSPAYKLRSPEQ
jgi:hypothetical protein